MAHKSTSSKSLQRPLGKNRSSNTRNHYGKTRAMIACGSCRKRKVRCDAVTRGYPCTNCRAGDKFCDFQKRKNCKSKKKSWLQGCSEIEAHPDLNHAERNLWNGTDRMLGLDHSLNLSEVDKKLLEYAIHGRCEDGRLRDDRSNGEVSDAEISYCDDLVLQTLAGPVLATQSSVEESTKSLVQFLSDPPNHIPSFLKSPSHCLTQDALDYLWKTGALTIPEAVLQNELIRSYIEHVHGYMPILDLPEFLKALDEEDSETEKMSLLLFQCVMFAGTAYVDLRHLIAGGFATRKTARKALFDKARLLYDFDYENDRISIVQSLLLMTFWCETPDDQKDLWYWMGLASSTSLALGLHNNLTKLELDVKTGRLLKRISWSCFMRDQVVALGMQRPAHISFKEHNIPMLTVEDFDIEAIPASDIGSVAGDSKYFQNLAILCIEKAKVCFYISRILSTQYTVSCQIKSQLVPAGIAPMNTLLPKIDNMMSEENRACDKQLQEWYSTRPKEVKQNPSSKKLLSTKEGSVMVHQAILDMLYSTAISALHRPQLLHPGLLHPGEPPIYQQESRYIVQREARKITTISGELNRLDLVRYLPGYTITVILPAIMIHLTTIKSGDSTAKQESYEGFCTCMVVMQQLRYTYNSADVITAILQSAIIKAAEDESGHTQSGPGLTDLTHFLNESSPIHHLGIGLTQDGQSGLENSEEFSPLFSSDISNVPNEFYSDDIGEQVSIHATSNITNGGLDGKSLPNYELPSNDMIDELISESLSSSSSLSLLHNTREIGSAPWDDTLLDAFDEIFGDFF